MSSFRRERATSNWHIGCDVRWIPVDTRFPGDSMMKVTYVRAPVTTEKVAGTIKKAIVDPIPKERPPVKEPMRPKGGVQPRIGVAPTEKKKD
jgi:hypothetical protein